ncbi:uncharacterized protein LOC144437876 [Glandiceps talaboti]
MDIDNQVRFIIDDLAALERDRGKIEQSIHRQTHDEISQRRQSRPESKQPRRNQTPDPLPPLYRSPRSSRAGTSPTHSELEDIESKATAALYTIKRTTEKLDKRIKCRDRKSHLKCLTDKNKNQPDASRLVSSPFFQHNHVHHSAENVSGSGNGKESVAFPREEFSQPDRRHVKWDGANSHDSTVDRDMAAIIFSLDTQRIKDTKLSSILKDSINDDENTSPNSHQTDQSSSKKLASDPERHKIACEIEREINRDNDISKVKVECLKNNVAEQRHYSDGDALKRQLESAVQQYYDKVNDEQMDAENENNELVVNDASDTQLPPSPKLDLDLTADTTQLKGNAVPSSINTPRSRTPINFQDLDELEAQVEHIYFDNNNDKENMSDTGLKGRHPILSSDSAIAMETGDSEYSPTDIIEIDDYILYDAPRCQRKKANVVAKPTKNTPVQNHQSQSYSRKDWPKNRSRNDERLGDKNHTTTLEKFDIIGDTSEHRFPWQRDVSIQCGPTEVKNQWTQTTQTCQELCEKCRVNRLTLEPKEYSRSPSPSLLLPNKLTKENGINFRNTANVKVQAVKPQISDNALDTDELDSTLTAINPTYTETIQPSEPKPVNGKSGASRTFSESSINNRFRDMYFRHIQPAKSSKSDKRHYSVSEGLSPTDGSLRRTHSHMNQRRRLRTAESVDLSIIGTNTHVDEDRISPSLSTSPVEWVQQQSSSLRQSPKVLVTQAEDDESGGSPFTADSFHSSQESLVSETSSLTVPLPETLQTRTSYYKDNMVKCSSGSDNPTDEEDDLRPPPSAFRRRRGAMTSETLRNTLQVQDSIQDEGDERPGIENRRPSAHIVSLPSLNISPGDLHVVDGVPIPGLESGTSQVLARLTAGYFSEGKKPARSTWTLRRSKKEKDKDKDRTSSLEDLSQVLNNIKVKEIDDFDFSKYKAKNWREFVGPEKSNVPLTDTESKRREAVWEILQGECVYLLDHLMVLRNAFLEPLKDVQVEGHLMFVEPSKLFANLDELCQVSVSFCQILEHLLSNGLKNEEFGTTETIVSAFSTFGTHQCPAYQRYCVNYSGALIYLEHLRKNPDFLEFLKWCEQDPRCNRLQVSDLMVAPIQHITKLPLLLKNVRKKTHEGEERKALSSTIQSVENGLREMEGKVKWLANFERLRELHHLISWPPIEDIDAKVFVPEFLRGRLNKTSSCNILASPKRILLHEGPILLSVENTKSLEVYLFLFNDMVLVTKMRKMTKKKSSMSDGMSVLSLTQQNIPHKKDGVHFTVYKQPIPLDRVELIEVEPQEANGLKNAFVALHISRYQQVLAVLTFQTENVNAKNAWLTQLRSAKNKWIEQLRNNRLESQKDNRNTKDRKRTL